MPRHRAHKRKWGKLPRLHSADQLLIWFLRSRRNDEAFIGFVFGQVSQQCVNAITAHVTAAFNIVYRDSFDWPSAEERKLMHGTFPCHNLAIAALDGTHTEISRPVNDEANYYSSHKNCHSQNWLIGVDAHAFVVFLRGPVPGRPNDRSFFKTTEFFTDPSSMLSPGECILVDGGFVGDGPTLMAFTKREMENAGSAEELLAMYDFNTEFIHDRSLVEHVIGRVKDLVESLGFRFEGSRETQTELMPAAVRLYNTIRHLRMCSAIKK